MVSITLRVLSRPDVGHLSKIYQSLGMDYDERVLPSIGNEVLKSIVAQFDAAELITQREVVSGLHARERKSTITEPQVSSRIRADLLQRAGEFNIKLEDVSITHLTFGKVGSTYNNPCIADNVPRNSLKLWRLNKSRSKVCANVDCHCTLLTFCDLDAERAKFIVEKVHDHLQLERRLSNHMIRLNKSGKQLSSVPKARQRQLRRYQKPSRGRAKRLSRSEKLRPARRLYNRWQAIPMLPTFPAAVGMSFCRYLRGSRINTAFSVNASSLLELAQLSLRRYCHAR
jgi:hypothetical protein